MKETLKATLWILLYGIIAVAIVYFTSMSGTYPDGADTMFYVYREDALYHSITEENIWYSLWNPNWYNGVQISRYWAPLCTYVMTFCQFICKGDPYDGYLMFIGLIYFVGAVVWLRIGYTHGRPYLGAFIGLIWGLLPHTLFQIYVEGVLVRCMIITWLPAFVAAIWDYFYRDRKNSLLKAIIYMFLMVMTHMGYAGMVALAALLYIVVNALINKTPLRKSLICIVGIVLSMVMTGIWLLPSLVGGITGIDSSSIMANYFQPLSMTINPLDGIMSGLYKWKNGVEVAYYGIVLFVLSILGVLFSRKKSKPQFAVGLITVLLTTTVAYPVLARLPGGSMLWMLRFMSIAICFALFGFLLWDTMKKTVVVVFCALLLIESIPSWKSIYMLNNGVSAVERYEGILDEQMLRDVREITVQRATIGESMGLVDNDAIYLLAGYKYNDGNIPITIGQGVQSAVIYSNIVQMNQSLEDRHFLYYFDRCIDKG